MTEKLLNFKLDKQYPDKHVGDTIAVADVDELLMIEYDVEVLEVTH